MFGVGVQFILCSPKGFDFFVLDTVSITLFKQLRNLASQLLRRDTTVVFPPTFFVSWRFLHVVLAVENFHIYSLSRLYSPRCVSVHAAVFSVCVRAMTHTLLVLCVATAAAFKCYTRDVLRARLHEGGRAASPRRRFCLRRIGKKSREKSVVSFLLNLRQCFGQFRSDAVIISVRSYSSRIVPRCSHWSFCRETRRLCQQVDSNENHCEKREMPNHHRRFKIK